MKYIDKQNETSKNAADILHNWRDTYKSPSGKNFETFCEDAQTTEVVWEILPSSGASFSKEELRQALHKEQKGVCCYCGQEIKLTSKLPLPIEHFRPKEEDKFKNTFNYFNLLLSCDGNKKEGKHYVAKGDSWESIAQKHEMTIERLKNKNFKEKHNELPTFKAALSIDIPPGHCDNAKGEKKDMIINPTEDKNCWEKFKYEETGEIFGLDDLAKKTIKVLCLDATILQKKRENAWKGFEKSLEIEITDIIEDRGLNKKEAIELLLRTEIETDKTQSFCVVKWALLKSIINPY